MGWYNSSWNYRVKITIDYTKVGSTLTDFPVYVNLNNLPAGFHSNVNQTDARDIRVTRSDGTTECAREVVSYDSSTDTGELHFKANSISSTVNTDFYIYYGNSSASDYAATATYGRNNVWSANYKLVAHMNNDPSGGTGSIIDSTSNSHNGTPEGSMTSEDVIAGKVGKGIDHDGTDDEINWGDNTDFSIETSNFSVSCWVRKDESSSGWSNVAAISKWNTGASGGTNEWDLGLTQNGNDNYPGFNVEDGSTGVTAYSTTAVTLGQFYYLVGMRDGTDIKFYVDGVLKKTTALGIDKNIDNVSTRNLKTAGIEASNNYNLDGVIDEVRIIKGTALSSGWISTEYNNQSSPSTFYATGSQETRTNSERGLYISGYETGFSERLLYIQGIDTGNSERTLYIKGVDTGNSVRGLYLEGTGVSGNSERNLYVRGIATGNSERNIYISGSQTLSTDYFNIDFALAIEATSERGLYIEGFEIGFSERNLYIEGIDTSDSERSLWIKGKETDTSERGLYIQGFVSENSERGLYLQGFDTSSSERGLFLEGVPVTSDRGLYIKGYIHTSSTIGLYLEGFDTGNSERDLYIQGRDTSYSEKSLYIQGCLSGSSERGLFIEGRSAEGERGLYIWGSDIDNSNRGLYIAGTEVASDSRGLWIQGKEQDYSSRGLYLSAKDSGSLERGLYLKGFDYGASEKGLYIEGGGVNTSERGLYLEGTSGSYSERGLYTQGKISVGQENWDIRYEANDLPEESNPVWLNNGNPEEFTNEIIDGQLHIFTPESLWAAYWQEPILDGYLTVDFRLKIISGSETPQAMGIDLGLSSGYFYASLDIDGLTIWDGNGVNSHTYAVEVTEYHTYRIICNNSFEFVVYIDGVKVGEFNDLQGEFQGNMVGWYYGSGVESYLDYFYYSDEPILPFDSQRGLYITGVDREYSERNLYTQGSIENASERSLYLSGKDTGNSERGIWLQANVGSEISVYLIGAKCPWKTSDKEAWKTNAKEDWKTDTNTGWKQGDDEKWYNSDKTKYKVGTLKPRCP